MFDIVYVRGESALKIGGNALFHLFRTKPRIEPKHTDDGNVDIRKNIDRHGGYSGAAQDGDQHRHHYEGIRAAESQPDNPHNLLPRTPMKTIRPLLGQKLPR